MTHLQRLRLASEIAEIWEGNCSENQTASDVDIILCTLDYLGLIKPKRKKPRKRRAK